METFTFQSHWSQKNIYFMAKYLKRGITPILYLHQMYRTIEYEKFKKDTPLYINRMEIDK